MTGDQTPPQPWPRPADGPAGPPPFPQPGSVPAAPYPRDGGAALPQFPPPGAAPLPPFPQPGAAAPPPFPPPGAGGPASFPSAEAAGYPPYPQYSAGYPGQPAPAPARSRAAVIAFVVVGVLLAIAGLGTAGSYLLLRSAQTDAAPAPTVDRELPDPAPETGSGPTPGAEEPAETGPFASEYPAEEIFDLNRVCDEDVYYPRAPKRAGKAPHPVALLVKDDSVRYQNSSYYMRSQGLSKSVRQIWAPEKPATVQLAACLDQGKTGGRIRSCKYDDPKPLTVTLHKSSWRLRVLEVATGRELLDKTMPGDDRACPGFVRVGPDRRIYANASDPALVNALKPLVKK